MNRRTLGRTGLQVSPLGFGGVEINGAEDRQVQRLLNGALDHGMNVVDTAECYGNSEELIGRHIGHRRDEYRLFTKCGHSAGLPYPDWDPRLLRASLERSLKRLGTDHVDVAFLHTCSLDELQYGPALDVLEQAKADGLVRFTGYSGDDVAALFALHTGRIDVLQTSVNIADQQAIDLTLPVAQKLNVGVVAKRPLANACWRTRSKPRSSYQHSYWERLQQLDYDFMQRDLDATFETALRFTLSVAGVSTMIVGTSRPDRWLENLRVVQRGALAPVEYRAIRDRWRAVADDTWTGER